jgi:hypothetical protein
MAERARMQAGHALGLLRVGMQMQEVYHRHQLRFRLGEAYFFAGKQLGWQQRDNVAYATPMNREMFDQIMTKAVMQVPAEPTNDLQKHALLAVGWINRGLVEADPLVGMLFMFFALEAMLGDEAEGQKSRGLAFRRAMLGHLVNERWPSPELIHYQYTEIRSTTVHGSEPPVVSKQAASRFGGDVILTLEQYLIFAAVNGFTKRSRVLKALAEHGDAMEMLKRLQDRDPIWKDFVPKGE